MMKKIISFIMLLIMSMSVMTSCSAAEITEDKPTDTNDFMLTMQIGNPNMTVNGKKKPIDEQGTVPIIVNNRTLLGYPIWYGTMPLIMNTFLEKYDMSGKIIIPFSTAAGSGFGSSIADLKKLCPNSNILDGYTVSGAKAKDSKDDVEKWLKEINAGGNTK